MHEFAHKLDMLDGAADGTPRLHPDMDLRTWIDSFTDTYKQLRKQIERHQLSQIDPYAVENPTEVFDVVSEECLCASDWLYQHHAGIYLQMACSIGWIQCCVFITADHWKLETKFITVA